ncbi:CU044_2847 family protein [Kitasatospora sp. NPDC058243]|uniref:CU044_2847 family protein n=1 Tax=Kitasatospora sp. NPDC058243 TaxID=3346397 RepID=UPI0036DD944D
MDQLLTVELGGSAGSVAVFEVDSRLAGSDLELAAGGSGVVGRAKVTLDEALEQVRPALASVVQTVRSLSPDEVELEFGLKVGGDTSVIIAKGTAEVNFAVRLRWKQS